MARPTGVHTPWSYTRIGTKDSKATVVKCRVCGELVTFDTDRNGQLVALDPDNTRHRHQDA